MKKLSILLFVCFSIISPSCLWAEVIDPERLPASGKWNPGIPGGIPSRTVICATIETADQGDDTSAIQSAIDSCGTNEVVKLGPGIFTVSRTIDLANDMVLRGSGISSTTLQFTASAGTNPVINYNGTFGRFGNHNSIISGYDKGSTSLEMASSDIASSYRVGQYVLISQADGQFPCRSTGACKWAKRSNRSQGQVLEINSISGNMINFSSELYYDYNASCSIELSAINGSWRKNAGLEDMYIYRVNGNNQQGSAINMSQTAYSWMKNVEMYKGYGHILRLNTSFRNIIRGNYIHHAWGYTSGATSYGIAVRYYSTDNLIENNIIFYFNNGIFIENDGGGNVVAYNFIDGIWLQQSGSENWQVPDFGDHCAHNDMDLFEGNQTTKTKLDNVHSSTVTYWLHFREWFDATTGFANEPSHPYTVNRNLTAFNADNGENVSVVGSVLGSPGQYSERNAYECRTNCDSNYGTNVYVAYRCRTNSSTCSKTLDSMFRHGNVDFITALNGRIRWEDGYDQTLPNSYYLSSKPSWWGEQGAGRPWPCIGPDIPGYVIDIPAKDRYEGETYTSSGLVISPPTNLRILSQ